LEIVGPSVRYVDRAALDARDSIQLLTSQLKDKLNRLDNLQIRNKGLSITIQWSTPHPPEIHKEIRCVVIDAIADGGERFTVRDAINSIEILPATGWNKGSAANWINRHLDVEARNSMYVGDDGSDEDVFATLHEGITVKVGPANNTRARYVLKDSTEVLTLLKLLLVLSRGF
jgi:trehalose-phosphatase